jgi:hypothetical protein
MNHPGEDTTASEDINNVLEKLDDIELRLGYVQASIEHDTEIADIHQLVAEAHADFDADVSMSDIEAEERIHQLATDAKKVAEKALSRSEAYAKCRGELLAISESLGHYSADSLDSDTWEEVERLGRWFDKHLEASGLGRVAD